MKHEFHAQFPFALQDSVTQGFAIPWLVGQTERLPAHWQEIAVIHDSFARVSLLAQAIVTGRKEEARMGTRKMSGGHRFWIENRAPEFLRRQRDFMQTLGVEPSIPPLIALPTGSWAIQFTFTLRTPYLSKDDTDFYILENPVKKEWVFKVPYVAPSQWKGALRAALWQLGDKEDHEITIRLFGNPRESEEQQAGRLYFFPTFFDKIGLEVINPHDRKTGVGERGPILMECVPQGARGTFILLYVPFNLIGQPEERTPQRAFADLQRVAEGLQAMFTLYGFGAKTSSGYGVAADKLSETGDLRINYPSAKNPIEEDFNSLSLLKRKADALKRLVEEDSHQ